MRFLSREENSLFRKSLDEDIYMYGDNNVSLDSPARSKEEGAIFAIRRRRRRDSSTLSGIWDKTFNEEYTAHRPDSHR